MLMLPKSIDERNLQPRPDVDLTFMDIIKYGIRVKQLITGTTIK